MLRRLEDNVSPRRGYRVAWTVCLAALWLAGCSGSPSSPPADAGHDALPTGEARCAQLPSMRLEQLPASGLVVSGATWRPEGFEVVSGRNGETTAVPAHCEIEGYYGEYTGRVGGVFVQGLGGIGVGGGHPTDDGPDWGTLTEILPRRVPWVLDLSPELPRGDVVDALHFVRSAGGDC